MQWWMLSLWLILQIVKSAPSAFMYLKCLAIETLDRVFLGNGSKHYLAAGWTVVTLACE